MKRAFGIMVFAALSLNAQMSYFNQGFLRQGDALLDRNYLGITNAFLPGTGVTFSTGPVGSGAIVINSSGGGGGSGTVTSFSAGNLSPIFVTSVITPTTTPQLLFGLNNQFANVVFAGPTSGGAASPTFRSLVAADIPSLSYVTSVGLSAPSIFSVSGSPVTSSGTLTFTLQNQSANTFFSGPASGGATTPTFRAVSIDEMNDVTITSPADGDILAYKASSGQWTNGPNTSGGSTSLPGLLQRPVYAASGGALSAPQWPDDTRYEFDEEFDTSGGTSSGQFGKYFWTGLAAGANSAESVPTNPAPHYGVIQMQVGPSTGSNFFYLTPYGGTSANPIPYSALDSTPGWLYHAIFFIPGTNVTYIVRMGLVDATYRTASSLYPSNGIWVRFESGRDTNQFVFEARSNSNQVLQYPNVIANSNVWYTVNIYSTNANQAVCTINSSSPVTISNLPSTNLTLFAYVAATNNGASQNNLLWLDRISFMHSGLSR